MLHTPALHPALHFSSNRHPIQRFFQFLSANGWSSCKHSSHVAVSTHTRTTQQLFQVIASSQFSQRNACRRFLHQSTVSTSDISNQLACRWLSCLACLLCLLSNCLLFSRQQRKGNTPMCTGGSPAVCIGAHCWSTTFVCALWHGMWNSNWISCWWCL